MENERFVAESTLPLMEPPTSTLIVRTAWSAGFFFALVKPPPSWLKTLSMVREGKDRASAPTEERDAGYAMARVRGGAVRMAQAEAAALRLAGSLWVATTPPGRRGGSFGKGVPDLGRRPAGP